MKPFLYQVASLFYERYGVEVSHLAFVFPNRRAGLFFKKYLSEVVGKPLFSPTILTIHDLFVRLSDKQPADRIGMLFRLYGIYVRLSGSTESFDDFLHWGEMLLNDFDDIDKYMVNAHSLFRNVTDLHELEQGLDFLSKEQVAAIRSFWSSFRNDTPNKQRFLAVWQILYELYKAFRASLAEEGKAYEGMIFREVVERLERGESLEWPYERVIFVGLNALSVSEERLLLQLQKQGIADFYWDYVSEKVTDPENKASYFVDRNRKLFPSSLSLPPEEKKGDTEIEVIGIPSAVGQAKQVYTLLSRWCEKEEMTPESVLRTAVVLPDERLLIPVLNAIPEQIRHINVTMGYPLAGTPVAVLVEDILTLQQDLYYVDHVPLFYFQDVLSILSHRYVRDTSPGIVSSLIWEITRNNKIYLSQTELAKTSLLEMIFTPVEDVMECPNYLIHVLEKLNAQLNRRNNADLEDEDREISQRAVDIEQEFIFHYFATVNRIQEVMRETGVKMRIDTFFRLLKRVTETITIPFHGEPLSGLQIMGVLETRALDFDRLIILSMNEGVFPQRKAVTSFIPYNLRRGFGLPTYEHQDSVWAYHFYRLIERASCVSLLYDTRSGGMQTGEVSRFVHQLRYHYEVPFHDKLVVYNVSSSTPVLEIQKGEELMRRLADYREGGEKALSASDINTYLDCPLKFYFSVLEGIREDKKVNESIESATFGSILHKVMELLYAPFCGCPVKAEDLNKIRNEDNDIVRKVIAYAFAGEFFKSGIIRPLTGYNFLTGEMIRMYVLKILEHDVSLAPFTYLESERLINAVIELSDHSVVRLKGFIDRMDRVQGVTRIIDYKSGSGSTMFSDIPSLFRLDGKERSKAVMQVFLYCWMYNRLPGKESKIVQPGVYFAQSLFTDSFDSLIYQRKFVVEKFEDYSEAFEQGLRGCLDDIFNPDIPFTQTPTGKACSYCLFKEICGKDLIKDMVY